MCRTLTTRSPDCRPIVSRSKGYYHITDDKWLAEKPTRLPLYRLLCSPPVNSSRKKATLQERKNEKEEGSYTCYLFEQGLDKILKKVGEESTEMVIAAKNGVKEETVGEICDLIYHTLVMMVNEGISVEDVEAVLQKRAEKAGNLKKFHVVDKNS